MQATGILQMFCLLEFNQWTNFTLFYLRYRAQIHLVLDQIDEFKFFCYSKYKIFAKNLPSPKVTLTYSQTPRDSSTFTTTKIIGLHRSGLLTSPINVAGEYGKTFCLNFERAIGYMLIIKIEKLFVKHWWLEWFMRRNTVLCFVLRICWWINLNQIEVQLCMKIFRKSHSFWINCVSLSQTKSICMLLKRNVTPSVVFDDKEMAIELINSLLRVWKKKFRVLINLQFLT